MPELSIISTCCKEADRPVVRIGMSEYPQEAKQLVTGCALATQAEIDRQIDDLIRQLELARKEAKSFLMECQTREQN